MKHKKLINTTFFITLIFSLIMLILSIVDVQVNYVGGFPQAAQDSLFRVGESFQITKWFSPLYPVVNSAVILVTILCGGILFLACLAIGLFLKTKYRRLQALVLLIFFLMLIPIIANYQYYFDMIFVKKNVLSYFVFITFMLNFAFMLLLFGFPHLPDPIEQPQQEYVVEAVISSPQEEIIEPIEPVHHPIKETIIINNYYDNVDVVPHESVTEQIQRIPGFEDSKIPEDIIFGGEKVIVREPFVVRLKNSEKELKSMYNELKAEFLSYGLKSRLSRTGDVFRLHRKTYAKISISGKSLKIYYALNPKDYIDTKIPYTDSGGMKSYQDIPFTFKVRSDLSIKRAKMLIADAAGKDGIIQVEIPKIKNYSQEAILTLDR